MSTMMVSLLPVEKTPVNAGTTSRTSVSRPKKTGSKRISLADLNWHYVPLMLAGGNMQ
jgi:hypothetical protein